MSRIELAPEVLEDFERFLAHWDHASDAATARRLRDILDAIDVLTYSPLIGRPVRGGLRELVIGRGNRGYIALYRYVPDIDVVFVLALRAQRESGFKH